MPAAGAITGNLGARCRVSLYDPVRGPTRERTSTMRRTFLSAAVLVAQLPDPSPVWLAISVAYVAYYVALSLHLTARRGRPAPTVG